MVFRWRAGMRASKRSGCSCRGFSAAVRIAGTSGLLEQVELQLQNCEATPEYGDHRTRCERVSRASMVQ
jgi:hypothetical protein